MTQPEVLLEIALTATAEVAPFVAEAFHEGVGATMKSSQHDLVTAVDREVETRLVRRLGELGPAAAFLGEEHGAHGSGDITWVIDPIDGTSNFVHSDPGFAISVAACIDGAPVAAVVHAPVLGEVYRAVPDAAWLGERRLSGAGRGPASACALATDHPGGEAVSTEGADALADLGALISAYATVRRPVCASLELAGVAAGRHDVVLGVDTHPWDVAAGALLVTASGGRYDAVSYSDGPDVAPVFRPCYVAAAPGADARPAEDVLAAIITRRNAAR